MCTAFPLRVSGGQHWTVWTLRENTSYHPHKSAITEYNINRSHYIQLHKTNIPAQKSRYMDHVIMDAIQQQFQGEWAVCEQVIEASYLFCDGKVKDLYTKA